MPKVIISYRRQDSQDIAGRIRDRLVAHYGDQSNAVYMDVDDIPPGRDFRKHIDTALSEGDILVAIIGPRWLGPKRGKRVRIDDPDDPVRVEIETAFARRLEIVPVLVGGAEMPAAAELPESIRDLAYRHAVSVDTGQDFHQQLGRLIRGLEQLRPTTTASKAISRLRSPLRIAGAGTAVAVLIGAVWLSYPLLWPPSKSETTRLLTGGVLIPVGPPDRAWPPPSPRSYWEAEKSLLYLEATGQARELIFDQPTQQLKELGARPGDLLFEGRRIGDRYEGTAYHYTGGCGTADRRVAYEVEGSVIQDVTVEWNGRVPVVDPATCRQARAIDDQLLFERKTTVIKFKIIK